MRYSYAIYFFLLVVGLMSCKDAFTFSEAEKDEIVVKIEDKVLFKSQLKNLIHEDMSPQDSITVVNGFIENWIRDNLMIIEAEKNVPAGLDLNKLLADYRASLLVYNFEKKLIEEKLDTQITEQQIANFYELTKDQYILSHSIYKGIVAVFPKNYAGSKELVSLLKKEDLSEAFFQIRNKATSSVLDLNKWYSLEEFSGIVPGGAMKMKDKLTKGSVLQFQHNGMECFVKIVDKYNENQVPPLEYIQDKIVKVILNNRKTALIKNIRQNLYDKAMASNKIKIHN